MRIIIPIVFEHLKQSVSDKSGIAVISPSDCKLLSAKIGGATNKQISDTTLKRIYGFAKSTFLPSLYTLNVLAEYCGYHSWEQFSDQLQSKSNKKAVPESAPKQSVVSLSRKISFHTLQALKNRSGIPFQCTIERKFITDHLEMFMAGNETATILTSRAGCGKTVGLCHWIEEQLNRNISEHNDNLLLFFSSNIFNGFAYGENLNHWLYGLMGLPVDGVSTANVNALHKDGRKICLVIDGFDVDAFKPEQFDYLFNMLIDVMAVNKSNPGFKIILTMRSATWLICRRRLHLQNGLDNWFLGFMHDNENQNNILPFTSKELDNVCRKIFPEHEPGTINDQTLQLFSYPLFLQYYYQKNYTNFNLKELDYMSMYEVIASYIHDKIYSSKFAAEKILLLRTIIQYGKFVNGKFLIDRLKVFEELKVFGNAYESLKSIGIIQELNQSKEAEYVDYIEFTRPVFLSYCLADKLVYDNEENFDDKLIQALNAITAPDLRLQILQWCIFNAVKLQQTNILDHVTSLELSTSDKANLLKFLSALIQRGYTSFDNKTSINRYFDKERPELFYYFFGVEFISTDYEQALYALLKLKLEPQSQIWIYTCLAIINIVKLNNPGVDDAIAALKGYDEEYYRQFDINPLYCIESIYHCLKYGKASIDALRQITHFIFAGANIQAPKHISSSNVMLNLLATQVIEVACSPQKVIRLVNVLERNADNDTFNYSSYRFFLQIALAKAHLNMGNIDEAVTIADALVNNYQADRPMYTSYMKISLDMVILRIKLYKNRRKEALLLIDQIDKTADKHHYAFFSVSALSMYIESVHFVPQNEQEKDIYYRFIKKVRSNGFSPDNFLVDDTSVSIASRS